MALEVSRNKKYKQKITKKVVVPKQTMLGTPLFFVTVVICPFGLAVLSPSLFAIFTDPWCMLVTSLFSRTCIFVSFTK